MAKITKTQRVQFSAQKTASMLKWVILSGSLTFFLMEIQRVVNSSEIDTRTLITLGLNALINTAIFVVAKYSEGK